MLIMMLNLGDNQHLIIPARSLISIMDNQMSDTPSNEAGCTIIYNPEDGNRFEIVKSKLSAVKTLWRTIEAENTIFAVSQPIQ